MFVLSKNVAKIHIISEIQCGKAKKVATRRKIYCDASRRLPTTMLIELRT